MGNGIHTLSIFIYLLSWLKVYKYSFELSTDTPSTGNEHKQAEVGTEQLHVQSGSVDLTTQVTRIYVPQGSVDLTQQPTPITKPGGSVHLTQKPKFTIQQQQETQNPKNTIVEVQAEEVLSEVSKPGKDFCFWFLLPGSGNYMACLVL